MTALGTIGQTTLKAIGGIIVTGGGIFGIAYPTTKYLTAKPRLVLASSSGGKELSIEVKGPISTNKSIFQGNQKVNISLGGEPFITTTLSKENFQESFGKK